MSVTTPDGPPATTDVRHPTAQYVVGLAISGMAFGLTAGVAGIVAGLALAGVGLFVAPLVAFGLGQALLLAVLPSPTLVQLGVVQATLFLLLIGLPTADRPVRLVAVAAILFAGVGIAVWYGTQTLGLGRTAFALLVGVGVAMYFVHRIERVTLGLAGGEET